MGGDKQQTTQATSEPWKVAQPALKTAVTDAEKLYKQGVGGDVFTGSTVTPWGAKTTKGMRSITDMANANMGGRGLAGEYQDIINQGGYNDAQLGAMKSLQGMPTSGLSNSQTKALGGLQALADDPFNSYQKSALQNTQNTANSAFDINANPAFLDVLRQAQGAARDSVNMSAGGAGRYGGGVHQGNLASEVGDLTSRMVGGEYQNWQNRRDAANSNLFNMGQTGIGTQMGANTGAANIGQQGMTNRTNTQNALFGMGQAAQGNLGAAYTGMQQPSTDLMKIGGMDEDLKTRRMNDRLRIFNEKQNNPWNQLGRLNAIASGAGQMGGTQTQSQPGTNPFLSALGYASGGAGLLGSFL